jgi:hypothetical protein
MISKTAAIVGFALSFLAAIFTSAAADVCADINAKVAQIQNSMAQMESERVRVGRMKPLPYTDAAMCRAALKVADEAQYLIFHSRGGCFSDHQSDTLFNAASEANRGASTYVGLSHCKAR